MSNTAPNPQSRTWDEKVWAYANLKAAKERGLTKAAELNECAADIIGLTPEQRGERSANKKLRHVVISEWSRTKLKNKGLIVNTSPGNGIWERQKDEAPPAQ